MAISQKLALRQTTALIMTPQLQQAIKLLQLSNQELETFLEAEIAENPFLERESAEGGLEHDIDNPETAPAGEDAAAETEEADFADDEPGSAMDHPGITSDAEGYSEAAAPGDDGGPSVIDDATAAGAASDEEFENNWTNDDRNDLDSTPPTQFADWGRGGGEESNYNIEDTLTRGETLREHLSRQVQTLFDDPRRRLVAAVLIDCLDEAGYLRADLPELAEQLGVALEEIEDVLSRAQECDPPGVFARDLGECLALQLRDRDRLDPAMAALIDNLDRLGRRDIAALKRLCGVDEEDLKEMLAEIRALDPKPGLVFSPDIAQTVIPDILVTAKRGGGWHIELNPDTLPRVLVNRSYFTEIKTSARTKDEREYISERLQSANWLAKALDQRATTILKVAAEIVSTQSAFFEKGIKHLKPLTLRDVAEGIGMHESTVSRVTTNKFMATPRGGFELKYFFTVAISATAGGPAHSAASVRQRIKDLIDEEPPTAILSDDRIVALLSGENIDIARRTVVKYRQAMGIPSSVQRRREKAMGLP